MHPVTVPALSVPSRGFHQAAVLNNKCRTPISVGRSRKLFCRGNGLRAAETSEQQRNISLNRRDSLFLGAGSALVALPKDAQAKVLSPEDAETLAVVKKVCKLIAKRDFEQLEELVDEECKVVKLGPIDLPYAGKYFGKKCISEYYAKFNQYFTIEKIPETLYYIGEANAIFVAHDYDYAVTSNSGVKLSTSATMKMVVRDGQLIKMAIIGDTLSEYLTLMKAGDIFMA
eukprot:1181827-Prorocentrum_minimum.AAC.4